MVKVVSNATPLIYLAKIGKLNLLKTVFGQIIITQEVKVEVVDNGKALGKNDSYLVEKAISDGWITVLATELIELPLLLDKGEQATLSLAKKLGASVVLIDEVSARTAARFMGLTPRGTLFVLMQALANKQLSLDEFLGALNELVLEGFRLKEEVYLDAVREARRIARD
jgi:predicted nucleic acid-binding protein